MTTALIVGGGIAGLTAAIALHEAGVESTVYERRERGSEPEGAFLTLAANGLAALAVLGAESSLATYSFDSPALEFRNAKGKLLGHVARGGPDGLTTQTIRRADLHEALRAEAQRRGVTVKDGKELAAAGIEGDTAVVVFADGTRARGDLLVGADGLRSKVRAIISPDNPEARYIPMLSTGGYAKNVDTGSAPGVFHMVFGDRCFFGHITHPDGSVWWFANPPQLQEPSRAELAAIGGNPWRARLVRLFAGDRGPAKAIIEATEDIFAPYPTYDLPHVPHTHNERMVVIGDAAHALPPASGQGASMAVEDAALLAMSLRDCPDVPGALASFAALRADRVAQVSAWGRRNSDRRLLGPLSRLVRDLLMPRSLAQADQSNGWIFDYRIDWAANPTSRSATSCGTTARTTAPVSPSRDSST